MLYGAINIDPETMGGTPVFKGTRVPIQTLFDYLEGGDTIDLFLSHYPSVHPEDAVAVIRMALQSLSTKKILDENFA